MHTTVSQTSGSETARSTRLGPSDPHDSGRNLGTSAGRFLRHPPIQRGRRDAKPLGRLPDAQPGRGRDLVLADLHPRPPETLSLGPDSRQPQTDALGDPRALELRDRAQNVHLKASRGRGSVDPLGQRYEGYPEGLKLFQKQNEVPETPAKPVEAPAEQLVEPVKRAEPCA